MQSFPTKMIFSNSSPKSQAVVHNALHWLQNAVPQTERTLSGVCPKKLIFWETMCGINIRNQTVINHHKWKNFKWKYFMRSNSTQTHGERTKWSNRSFTNQTSQISKRTLRSLRERQDCVNPFTGSAWSSQRVYLTLYIKYHAGENAAHIFFAGKLSTCQQSHLLG